jgi:hypothetical protein
MMSNDQENEVRTAPGFRDRITSTTQKRRFDQAVNIVVTAAARVEFAEESSRNARQALAAAVKDHRRTVNEIQVHMDEENTPSEEPRTGVGGFADAARAAKESFGVHERDNLP